MSRDTARIKYHKGGGGMGQLKMSIVRESDGVELGTYTYNPGSESSINALDEHLASLQGRYQVDIVED